MSESEKLTFDQERMVNPFGDTRLVCGDTNRDISSVMVGIDIDGRELLAWHALNEGGRRIDAIIAHHTSGLGKALASPYDTMCVQIDMMVEAGVPIHIAEKVICRDIAGKARGEDYRNVMLADLFNIPILAIHTPADNYGFHHTVGRIKEKNCIF